MLPMTLQFLIVMIAFATNDRLGERLSAAETRSAKRNSSVSPATAGHLMPTVPAFADSLPRWSMN
jgi:hypothetical protein